MDDSIVQALATILELDEQYREPVEGHCAITRLIRFKASHGGAFDDEGLDWENVE